ncbi:hypothetical protein GCM10020369_34020 [Cryptosporangium minutisporangium]|uniref:Uncharacterized protein n=1 Tax=Cryptosporangium minutisporangium TaxID=113569 RepID=A0ABP6SY62_9ACTN
MAYSGGPVLADDLLFRPKHSIIDQSLHADLGGITTNGDGFGIGWYGIDDRTSPTVCKGTHPAWTDQNLRELDDSRFIVSEPLRDLPGAWSEVPEGSWALVRQSQQETHPFQPIAPAS